MRSCALDDGLGLGSHVQIAVQRAVVGHPTSPSHASPGSIAPFPHPAGTPSVVVVVVVTGVLVVVAGMLEVVAAVLDGLAMVVVRRRLGWQRRARHDHAPVRGELDTLHVLRP